MERLSVGAWTIEGKDRKGERRVAIREKCGN